MARLDDTPDEALRSWEAVADPGGQASLLSAAGRLARLAASGVESSELADSVARETVELFAADAGAVFRYEEDAIVVVGSHAVPGQAVFSRGGRFALEDQMMAALIRDRHEAVRFAEYEVDPTDAARRIASLGVTVVVGAPIFVGDELWGTLTVAAREREMLPPGSEARLQLLADLCAGAVANAEDRSRLEAHAAEQQALLRMSRAVLEQQEEADVLRAIPREAAELLGMPAAALIRFGPGGTATTAATWHEGDRADGRDDVAALVRECGTPVVVGDPDATARPGDHLAIGYPVGWGVPIEIERRVWGALVVGGDQGRATPTDAGQRLARFAELSGVAIAKAEADVALLDQLGETERFAALVELSDDFIAMGDLAGRCTYLNSGGRRLLGLDSLEEATSYPIAAYLTEEGRRASVAVEQPHILEHGSWRGESTLRHFRTGEVIPVSVNSFLVTHPISGAPLALATVQRDLRERQRAEQELRVRAEEVESLAAARRFLLVETLRAEDRMRRQIADALHDEVLQELYAARQDLQEVAGDDDALARARLAVDAAGRQLREAVSDLHPAVAMTRDVAARLRGILDQGSQRAGFAYKLRYEAAPGGDEDDLILGLARELIRNVIKHAGATSVEVGVRDEGEALVLEVVDDGRGMAAERPDEALRAGHVGLASARERVEAMGGEFRLSATPGAGMRVRVSVPRAG